MKHTLIKLAQMVVLVVLCAGFTAQGAIELFVWIETGSVVAALSAAALLTGGFATYVVIVNNADPHAIRRSLDMDVQGEQAP